MKYLVDKKTKEHRPYYGGSLEWAEDQGLDIVRADSEGWILHTGTECPLPDNCRHDVKFRNGDVERDIFPPSWDWRKDKIHGDITHYRPILAEKAKEPVTDEFKRICEEAVKKALCSEPIRATLEVKTLDLLDRLKAAHKAAQTIPDLEAELREVLAGMGYTLGKLSPFVERPSIKTMTCDWQAGLVATEPTEDMSDWRNWREGDDLMCVKGGVDLKEEKIYPIATRLSELCVIDDHGCQRLLVRINHLFRFHSRPEKGE